MISPPVPKNFQGDAVVRQFMESVRNKGIFEFHPFTTTERDALNVRTGTVLYNKTLSKLQVYNGATWDNL